MAIMMLLHSWTQGFAAENWRDQAVASLKAEPRVVDAMFTQDISLWVKRFKSASQLQRFVSIHDPIANLSHFPRHALSSSDYRDLRSAAVATWREIAHLAAAA
ncbi:hypothetical protein BLM14_16045 [Phyllobacterium zundukense]|nr:hypothetical protein BLM14_16045 [Phyllobacterium zundukense]